MEEFKSLNEHIKEMVTRLNSIHYGKMSDEELRTGLYNVMIDIIYNNKHEEKELDDLMKELDISIKIWKTSKQRI